MDEVMNTLRGLEEAWLPLLIEYGSKLALALLTLLVGWWLTCFGCSFGF